MHPLPELGIVCLYFSLHKSEHWRAAAWIFALFVNIQVEHIREGKKALPQAPDTQRAAWASAKATPPASSAWSSSQLQECLINCYFFITVHLLPTSLSCGVVSAFSKLLKISSLTDNYNSLTYLRKYQVSCCLDNKLPSPWAHNNIIMTSAISLRFCLSTELSWVSIWVKESFFVVVLIIVLDNSNWEELTCFAFPL